MTHHRISRGLDIPIAGAASGSVVQLDAPDVVAIDPREFRGYTPRLDAREGDAVVAGQPLLRDKFHADLKIVSPVSGTVEAIERGARRVITAVKVRVGEGEPRRQRSWSSDALRDLSASDAMNQLAAGGGLALIRTRPLDHVPSPSARPQAVLIAATETGPLQPGVDVLLSADDRDALQAAIHVFNAVAEDKVFLTTHEGASHAALSGLSGVEQHSFSGPHPAGDPGLQVNHLCPPRAGGAVWTLRVWDAVLIGRLFLDGLLPAERTYAAVGVGVKQPRFVRTLLGAPIRHVVGEVEDGPMRWIAGSVLTGRAVGEDGFAPMLSRGVHVLPDTVERVLLGWAAPQLGRWSAHKAYLSGLLGWSTPQDLRPGLFGGERAIVPTGAYERVVATPDILPTFLFKAIMADDLERSIKLGLLDITEEEAALCSFVCPSKTNFDDVLRKGLEQYAKEV